MHRTITTPSSTFKSASPSRSSPLNVQGRTSSPSVLQPNTVSSPPKTKPTNAEPEARTHVKQEAEKAAQQEEKENAWRVILLRGLIEGNLEVVSKTMLDHIEHISNPFTSQMPNWQLQWESLQWWFLQHATPLFLASVYAHPHIIRWLLLYGADREIKCYLGRQPVDFVGECSTGIVSNTSNQGISSSSRPMNTRQNKSKDIEECMNLLTQSAFVPSPPMELLFDCHFSSEVVVRTVSTPMGNSPKRVGGEPSGDQGTGDAWSANMPKTTLIQQKIYKCLVNLTWTTPCSNGSMIDIYEVRYRMAEEENEELLDQKKRANNEEDNTDQEEDEEESNEQDDEEEASESAKKTKRTSSVANRLLASANASWRTERTNHTRHGLQQGIVLEGMQFNTWYEFMVRSWNSTGRGDWGKSFKFKTMISPGEVTTNSKEQVLQ